MLRQEDKTTTDFGNILISQVSKISTLVKLKKLKTDTLKMVVVDEADYFFESPEDRESMKTFYERNVPEGVQKVFFSATYSDEVSKFIKQVVPTKTIKIEIPKAKLNLRGIHQHFLVAK